MSVAVLARLAHLAPPAVLRRWRGAGRGSAAADLERAGEWVTVCREEELAAHGRVPVVLPTGVPVVVLLTGTGPKAFVDRCPHLGRRLADGEVRGDRIRCRGHGREYRLTSGRPVGRCPARDAGSLTTVPVAAVSGRVLVRVDVPGTGR
jgi:nitrite reductase/ring-hydroxylating ferredoxin subunit